jgi:uncharacterized membrane protein (DUF4010 family)
MPDNIDQLMSLGLALGLGMLVGLQREWERNRVAGLRTFALISLSGALSAVLAREHGDWVMGASIIAFTAITIAGFLASLRDRKSDPGLTTAIAMLVMFAVGALTIQNHRITAVVVAGTVMVLLQEKETLHGMVRRFGEKELREIVRLVLIGLVILPLLPNESFGDNELLNPFTIWLMVVLIVGISLAAYLTSKFLGNAKGTAIAGILGGLISSTATTVSVARRSKRSGSSPQPLAVITLIAGAVVFVRVIAEVVLVGRSVAGVILPPLVAMMVFTSLVAAVAYRMMLKGGPQPFDEPPPSELKNAVMFGLLYVLVLLGVSYAKQHFGDAGMFTVAAISGLTDMDAITLSTAGLSNSGQLDPNTAWRVILTGGIANMVFKSALAIGIGGREYIKPVLLGFAVTIAGGLAILFLWP